MWTQVGALRRCWAAAELWPCWEADVGEEPYYYQNTEWPSWTGVLLWTLWLSWIGLPSAQLNAPTDDDSWVEVKIKWQTKQDCLMWKEVGLFTWQRVSIFKGQANLARSWLPVSAVTSALNSSQEEPGDHQTARCWCCQTPVVGQFEASWEEMLSLLSAGHHGQAVCVGVERKTFKEIDNCYHIFFL